MQRTPFIDCPRRHLDEASNIKWRPGRAVAILDLQFGACWLGQTSLIGDRSQCFRDFTMCSLTEIEGLSVGNARVHRFDECVDALTQRYAVPLPQGFGADS